MATMEVKLSIPAERWRAIEDEAQRLNMPAKHLLNRIIKKVVGMRRHRHVAQAVGLQGPPRPSGFRAESLDAPASLASPEFNAAWARWCAYRRAKGFRIKQRVMRGHMLCCVRLGGPAAIEAIDYAIANGWRSLIVRPADCSISAP